MLWLLACRSQETTISDWRGQPEEPFTTVREDSGDPVDSTVLDSADRCTPTAGREVSVPVGASLPGAIVELGADADTPSWPSVTPRVEDGTAALLFSDSPETVSGPGLLYGDQVSGPARLYLYHASGPEPLQYGLVARGVGGLATLTVTASGLAGPSPDYLYTGRVAALRWLQSRRLPAPRVVEVPEGAWVSLDPAVDALEVQSGRLLHGLWDVAVAGTAEVRFVAVSPGTDAAAQAGTLAALPRDGHDRGTFVPADRSLSVDCLDTTAGSVRFRLGDGVDDASAVGVDALTGVPGALAGNYGVRYSLGLSFTPSADRRRFAVLLAPRGGALAGAVEVSDGLFPGSVFDFPRDADAVEPGSAVLLGVWDPAVHARADLTWTPAGSSSLPVDVLLVAFGP